MTEDNLCENCGHLHGELGCYICDCKKFKAKTSLDKKSKKWDLRRDWTKAKNHKEKKNGI